MANDQGITPGGLLVAFMAGAAVGAAVALLFAPASGEETRDFLSQRAREGRDRANEAARQGRDMLNRQRETISHAFERRREHRGTGEPGRPGEQDA